MGVSSSCGWGTIIDTVLAPSTQPDHNQVPIFSHQAERPSDQTVDADEVAHFELLSQRWWEPNGPMAALFKLNPTRIAYIRDQITAGNTPNSVGSRPFKGLTLLDVGCGGGLLSEPLARLGATVTGIDAAKLNIEVAAEHARQQFESLTNELAEKEKLWQNRNVELRQDLYRLGSEYNEMLEVRNADASGIPEDDLARYTRLFRSNRGVAVVRVERGVCQGCAVRLPVGELTRLRNADGPIPCSCGRALLTEG